MDDIYKMIKGIDKTIGTTGWTKLVLSRIPNAEEELTIRVLVASKAMTLDTITAIPGQGCELLVYSDENKDELLMIMAEPYVHF